MTKPFSPAEQLKAEQLRASIAAKLPISLAFDAIEAEFLALRQAWPAQTQRKESEVKA